MLNRLINFVTSLRLTVACLAMAIVLVFVGTLAQVNLGLYVTQEKYFRSLLVFWTPSGSDWRIPVWPGGYLLGWVLLVNLIAAHIKRFKFTWRKSGIFLTHVGLILLLAGQFLTEVFQVESFMRLEENGEARNYSEDARKNEIAIVDVTHPNHDTVVAIPEAMLAAQNEIRHPHLPFTLRTKEYVPNSFPSGPMDTNSSPRRLKATQGVGQRLAFDEVAITAKMDDENKPAAVVEVVSDQGSLGDWVVTTWLTKYRLERSLPELRTLLQSPQQFAFNGRTYQIALRPIRYYKPYSIQLLDFTHAKYRGTTVPKDYSSRIYLNNPEAKETREVKIYMNNPLRYGGETYYQASFEPGDTVSVLQVVRNPAWLTPYFSCTLVGLGLIVQFTMHLVAFLKKATQKIRSKTVPSGKRADLAAGRGDLEPAGAAAGATGSAKTFRTSPKRRNS
ncbi:MAG: cytochrome c biogenesis protein ResB [Verrucomicrobia bacterium]|nr:cytochrome c biogenesis protein ResB [Verrucomicrobiota bacterium]